MSTAARSSAARPTAALAPPPASRPLARQSAGSGPHAGRSPATADTKQASRPTQLGGAVAVLVLARMQRSSRLWAWGRLVRGAGALRAVPGLRFAKVMGSGVDGGFGLKPSGTHRGLFLLFDDEAAAHAFVDGAPELQAYRQRADELLVSVLRASGCKGSWSGVSMAATVPAPDAAAGPIAALTRASIDPRRAVAFWRLSPPAERALAQAPGCRLAVGLGEAPLLRQCTFSLWDSTDAMDAYARSGAHQQAIRTAYAGGYFTESMFVRFVPLRVQGVWQGRQHG